MSRLQSLKALGTDFFHYFERSPLQMLTKRHLLVFGQLLFSLSAAFSHAATHRLVDGKSGNPVSLEQSLSSIKPGSVVVIGEQHAFLPHQAEQLQILKKAQELGLLVSVGMEFFAYPDQAKVDQWRSGALTEPEFLKQVGWGGFSFDFYRAQVQVPRFGHEMVLALNAPRALTGKVAKLGLGALTAEEQALLPPQFEIGNARYFERFKESIGHLPDPKAATNYFAAQSIWDDTMAWQAAEFLRQHPAQTLFIIVGEFHVQYGGGLPDRLRAHGLNQVLTFSLVNLEGMSEQEELEATRPSALDGPRADLLWLTRP